jgi:high-affinity iron transporter
MANFSFQCCNAELNGGGGWGIFNALFGWQNSATYGSVLAYNFYWIAVIVAFLALGYNEKKGHWPFMKAKKDTTSFRTESNSDDSTIASPEKTAVVQPSANIREVQA